MFRVSHLCSHTGTPTHPATDRLWAWGGQHFLVLHRLSFFSFILSVGKLQLQLQYNLLSLKYSKPIFLFSIFAFKIMSANKFSLDFSSIHAAKRNSGHRNSESLLPFALKGGYHENGSINSSRSYTSEDSCNSARSIRGYGSEDSTGSGAVLYTDSGSAVNTARSTARSHLRTSSPTDRIRLNQENPEAILKQRYRNEMLSARKDT